jgi:MtN3 and saliva related transmembrane protein
VIPAEVIGTIAAGCTTFSLLPQIIKGVRTREMHDVSLGTLLLVTIGVLIWMTYGILRKDPVLIIGNAFQTGLSLGTLYLKWKYGWNSHH